MPIQPYRNLQVALSASFGVNVFATAEIRLLQQVRQPMHNLHQYPPLLPKKAHGLCRFLRAENFFQFPWDLMSWPTSQCLLVLLHS